MTPREGALLAPEWVPWEERLRPSDVSRDDVLPYKADDERLEQGFEDTSEDPDLPVVHELGLGRPRVLSETWAEPGGQALVRVGARPEVGSSPAQHLFNLRLSHEDERRHAHDVRRVCE